MDGCEDEDMTEPMMEDVNPAFQNSDNVEVKELLLDTGGSCFLCLNQSSVNENSVGEMEEVCLRNICRYLNIDKSFILENFNLGVEKDDTFSSQTKNCDFIVRLCYTCSSITTQLSQLIRDIELKKMLMHQKVREFHQVLMSSENNRWDKEMFSDNPGACVLKLLRLEAKVKCSEKIKHINKSSVPTINLTRIDKGSIAFEKPLMIEQFDQIPGLNSPDTALACKQSTGVLSEAESASEVKMMRTVMPNPISITVRRRMSKILDGHCDKVPPKTQPGVPSKILYQCRLCKSQEVQTKSKVLKHFAHHHPEKYFYQKEPIDLSEAVFKSRCLNVVKEAAKNTLATAKTLLCSFCGLKTVDNDYLIDHLIVEHNEKLQERINSYQEETLTTAATTQHHISDKTRKILRVLNRYCKSVKNGRNGYCCSLCKFMNADPRLRWQIRRHIINEHPEKVFAEFRPNHIAEEVFHSICTKALSSAEIDLNEITLKSRWSCRFCDRQFTSMDLRLHFVTEHYIEFKEKLMDLIGSADSIEINNRRGKRKIAINQNEIESNPNKLFVSGSHVGSRQNSSVFWTNSQPSGGTKKGGNDSGTLIINIPPGSASSGFFSKNTYSLARDPLGTKELEHHNNSSPTYTVDKAQEFVKFICASHSETVDYTHGTSDPVRLKCLVCNYMCSSSKIRYHIVTEHPDKFFSDTKPDNMNEDMFTALCKKAFILVTDQAECASAMRPKGKQPLSCPSCYLRFPEINDLRYHTIIKHYDIVTQKLMDLQNGTNKEENFRTSDSTQRTQRRKKSAIVATKAKDRAVIRTTPQLNLEESLNREDRVLNELVKWDYISNTDTLMMQHFSDPDTPLNEQSDAGPNAFSLLGSSDPNASAIAITSDLDVKEDIIFPK